jgi:hypothetical protein
MTVKPDTVRLAKAGDQELLFALACASDDEWCMGERDDDKVRHVIRLAIEGGPPPRPVFGVIRGRSIIEGAIGLYPTEPWNSADPYLRAFFHFVHPEYRKSRHAVHLTEFAKWFAEKAGLPVVLELLHPERTEAKERMYGRQAKRIGGLYIHGAALSARQAAA